jgi:hypothetical protein
MAADPWSTPNRRPQLEPDTVPRELDFDTPGTHGSPADPLLKQIHAWSAGAHVWGCFGKGFRVVVTLTNVGSGPKGGVTLADYLAFLEKQFLPMFKRHFMTRPS